MARGYLPKTTLLRTGVNESFYDLNTMLVSYHDRKALYEDRTPEEFISLWQTFVHERCHYLQHIGTTTGAFLSLLRFNRLYAASEQLGNLPSSVRSQMVADRKRNGGRAILAVDWMNDEKSWFRLSPSPPGEPEDADIFRQIIFENWWAWQAMYDWPKVRRIGYYKKPEQMFALILRDAINRSHELFDTPKENLSENDMQVSEPLIPKIWHGNLFGTTSLMEGAAIANELLYLIRIRAPIDQINARLNYILNTSSSYGIALRMYLRESRLDNKRLTSTAMVPILIFFSILCDVALNPPLPPVVTAPLPAYRWEELFPPLRFSLALNAQHVFDMLRPTDDLEYLVSHEFVTKAVSEVCQACKFLDITKFTFPISGIPPRFVSKDLFYNGLSKSYTCKNETDYDRVMDIVWSSTNSYDYLLCMHRLAWTERQRNLPAIVLPGYDFSRFASQGGGIIFLDGMFAPGMFAPPICIDKRTLDLHATLGSEPNHAAAFEIMIFADYLFDEILNHVGEPRLPAYWDKLYRQKTNIFEVLTNMFAEKIFGQSPW